MKLELPTEVDSWFTSKKPLCPPAGHKGFFFALLTVLPSPQSSRRPVCSLVSPNSLPNLDLAQIDIAGRVELGGLRYLVERQIDFPPIGGL